MSDQPKATPQLSPERFKPAEAVRNLWAITVEPGITRAEVLDPAFLAHSAYKLTPYDEITVRCDDGTVFARLLVLESSRAWARTRVLEWVDLSTKDVSQSQAEQQSRKVDPTANATHRLEHKGQHKKWCVIRNVDGAYVRETEPTKDAAQKWLDEYLRVTETT